MANWYSLMNKEILYVSGIKCSRIILLLYLFCLFQKFIEEKNVKSVLLLILLHICNDIHNFVLKKTFPE